jgi:tRNA-dihydrouridine synthase B
MIASQAMIRETRQSLQKAAWDPVEDPVSMQLAGCAPEEMAEAARLNQIAVLRLSISTWAARSRR